MISELTPPGSSCGFCRLGRRYVLGLFFVIFLLPALSGGGQPSEIASPGEPSPDPHMLSQGLWIGRTAAGDTVLELTLEATGWAGHSYLVRDGKALSEVPVVGVRVSSSEEIGKTPGEPDETTSDALLVTIVEIRLKTGWAYSGRLSVDGSKLNGELDMGRGRRQELDLRRVGSDAVPAVRARPSGPPGEPAYAYHRPAETDDGWTTASAAETGLELERIEGLLAEVIAGKAGLIHSLLLVKGGRLVVEEYFHGFEREGLHVVASCTKSVASLLIGLAIERGELAGVDTPLLALFPELRPSVAPGWEGLTVRHLLTMTSGIDPPGERPPAGPALVKLALSHPPAAPVGERWRYSDLDADLLAAVLHRASGAQADLYAQQHLFSPLGITRWDWEAGKLNGYPRLYGTLRLRPRDMAKLGTLILNGGRWQGRQVVSEEWIRESTREQIRTDNAGYGYLWWREPIPPSVPGDVISARGVGSQFIYVDTGRDLVVVVTGGNSYNGQTFRIADLLARNLLPPP